MSINYKNTLVYYLLTKSIHISFRNIIQHKYSMIRKRIWHIIRNIFCIVLVILIFFIYIEQRVEKATLLAELPESVNKFISFEHSETPCFDVKTLQGFIKRYNDIEVIHNSREFGSEINKSNIFVIQVNKFSVHLKYMIASLSTVRGIQDVLVIFSHSFYDQNINELIVRIDFCRVLQIFYPYSLQLYPNGFFELSDDLKSNRKTKYSRNCLASFIDKKIVKVEKKLHWWWTANKVFENLSCIDSKNTNLVIFMDDEQFLLEDFLYMADYMKRLANSMSQSNFISLATINSDIVVRENDSYRVELTTWHPLHHSEVLGFDFSTWNTIVSHFDLFCVVDDSSWPRSLQYVSLNRLDGKRFEVVSSATPRSFRTSCGVRMDVTNCDIASGIYKALSTQKRLKNALFPPFLEVYTDIELLEDDLIKFEVTENDLSLNDVRYKELCNNITISKIQKLLLEMKTQFSGYNT